MTGASSGGGGGGRDRRIVLAYPLAERLWLGAGYSLLGIGIGLALPVLARKLLGLGVPLPVRPVFRLFAAADAVWEVAICLTAGLVIGVVAATATVTAGTPITAGETGLSVRRGGRTQVVARRDVDTVFMDGARLVVLDHASRQVIRDVPQAPARIVMRTLRSLSYPWCDGDPYADLYRRWHPHAPDLPPAVNAVLAAREIALKKKADRDVYELGATVEELGFAVRDEGARQYWRPLVRS